MRWDIFCKVIDNHGDVGVCWRLACGLATGGDTVRLWIDDPSALAWMAPQGHDGVRVVTWSEDGAGQEARAAQPPDVLIEAFGCDPAPELVARFAEPLPAGAPRRVWLNLEYLSAEPYVERLHGLPSPVFKGPGTGLTKYFFYPGFTRSTGGLLREEDLPARRARFDRAAWLAQQNIDWNGERLVCLFCYEPPALGALLARFEQAGEPTRLLVTAGRASRALPPGPARRGALSIQWLPHLSQTDFDHLLWACDLNFVRGEDSLVRALWAGAPFVWQIYPQDDDAHHTKLDAFLDWLEAPPLLRRLHHLWNGMAEGELPDVGPVALPPWRAAAVAARDRLLEQDGLLARLRQFVAQKS
ncbi:elongation factor P maturation arginine rhamnosyltransferase EarP [Variovorax sp. DT-64]|uniref:elongation factor P maturation arginine rhamnosyltransferase EarP n=1 Tax=Variovorax sp. DT-64 TaxID=3396160 RepID=UPI003F1BDE04